MPGINCMNQALGWSSPKDITCIRQAALPWIPVSAD